MNWKNPIRRHGPLSIFFAALTLLAILIAPACAPLCAAKHCSSGARPEQCHEIASTGDLSGELLIPPGKNCALADFSAVLVKAEEQSSLSRGVRSNPAPAPLLLSLESAVGSFQANPARWGIHQIPLESSDSLSLTTILRI
jgi:hypothetical protein